MWDSGRGHELQRSLKQTAGPPFHAIYCDFSLPATARGPGPPPIALAALFERKPRAMFLRLLHPVFADLTGHDDDVAEVEVQVIVDTGPCLMAVAHDTDVVAELFG